MITLLTILALPPAIWAADRFLFHGELTAMLVDEVRVVVARRRRPETRRGTSAR